jgi:hypothetical protein
MINAVAKRRSLTPIAGLPPVTPGTHAMRRGDPRKEVSDRVLLKAADGAQLEGWALNASAGGVRAILEDKVDLGHEFDVTVGDPEVTPARKGRIVWLQEEPDGVIVGVEYTSPAVSLEAVTTRASSPPPSSRNTP